MSAPVSVWRSAFLLTRLRLRRQLNQFGASFARLRARQADKKAATRTSPARALLTAVVTLAMLGSFANLARQSMSNMENVLGSQTVRSTGLPGARDRVVSVRRPIPPLPGTALAPGVMRGATLAVSLLTLAALLIALASREIARPEWDLEWLATLPLPMTTLLASRLTERVLTNSAGFLALAPFLSVLAWFCGYRWAAPVLGTAFSVVLLVLVATVQTMADTGLRLSLPPHRLRNFHATVSIIALPVLFLAISMAFPADTFIFAVATLLPDWTRWLPVGLAVQALAATEPTRALVFTSLLLAEVAAVVVAGLWLLARQLRNGVVAVGVREAAGRLGNDRRIARAPVRASALISPVQRRELLLLARDRTFMVQTLVLPLSIVGMQVLLNVHSNIFAGAVDTPSTLAALAFGLAAYTLMFSAFQTLNAEGQALWILYCVPHPLETVLRQKAALWATMAILYPLAMFVIAIVVAGGVSWSFLASAAIVLMGVPIFATIAVALGVFGCDPLAQDVRRRVRPTYLYLYMVLVSLYAYAIFSGTIWQRAALLILSTLLAIALWQKARDHLPYLLDPSASPPAHVSLSDGLIAALLFFVLQGLLALLVMQVATPHMLTTNMVWIAFCGAGAITYGAMRLVYWRAHTAGVPRVWSTGLPRALVWGIVGGIAASVAGVLYIEVALAFDLFPGLRHASLLPGHDATLWLAAIAIFAAPIFEEFIFRGLIFGGLRRSFGFIPAALASAAIFAIVHPPPSVIPVFLMGLAAAFAYERTRMLAAPMAVHAIYNAAVLGFQLNVMQPS
ncbi:MAG: CPBP family intramembrane metalloprotease [Xanthobacteraceae bacterium]|nr:CPBP family intramembrane metalloprotease [Xanthobacteraceae bacterium]